MKDKAYFWKVFLMAALATPLMVSVGIIAGLMASSVFIGFILIIPAAVVIGLWVTFMKSRQVPEDCYSRYAPVVGVMVYYLGTWVIGNALQGTAGQLLTFFHIPYVILLFLLSFSGQAEIYPFLLIVIYGLVLLTLTAACLRKQAKIKSYKNAVWLGVIVIILIAAAFSQIDQRRGNVLGKGYGVERIQDEINYYDYRPFRPNSLLQEMTEEPSLIIRENYPRLDGATAAYPVYGAMVQAIYQGLDEETVTRYVQCSKTGEAYERLINGEVDIFFGAQPSEDQQAAAKEKGVKLTLTPIAREGFVFFVNRNNPLESLTISQIQDIYAKKITNWQQVGGKNHEILAFQRPEGSGSQTIMQAKVMAGLTMPQPLQEEFVSGMGGVINEVAAYRNYQEAIGYSFRYFATGMKPNENIRLLAIDGAAPTVENIRNGSYPFTVDVYAVTAGTENENAYALVDWIQSSQGQAFIEQCGYVGRTNP